MATFVLIHGAGDVGWYWHLTEAELRARGHDTIAPDLPCDNDTASLDDYVGTVADAAAGRPDLVIVSQSYGSFTATLAASRLPARLLVLLAGMIPAPGESPGQWWDRTGYRQAVQEQARRDGGKTGHDDPFISYYNGELGKYGKVLRCQTTWHGGDANVNIHGSENKGHELTCDKSNGDTVELKVGTEENQHLVTIHNQGKGTKFALVYVRVRDKDTTI